MGELNLIRLFGFYLAVMFLFGTVRRVAQYRDVGRLLFAMPGRWPRLLALIREHRELLLNWSFFRPLLSALALTVLYMVASRLVWPQANLVAGDLAGEWRTWPLLVALGVAMLGVDLWFLLRVGRLDHAETAKYLDEAEHWLTTWKAPVVRVVTLGYVNPREIVSVEVQKALQDLGSLTNRTLWWSAAQISLRLAFGLTLWGVWVAIG